MASARFDVQHVLPHQFTDLLSLPAQLGIQSVGEPQSEFPFSPRASCRSFPPATSSSCSSDFFKWKLFIRPPPPVHDCVKLHGLICAAMIRARREICAPRRFPRRFTISRLPFPQLRVVIASSRGVSVFLLPLALPVDSFVCSAQTDFRAKQPTHKTLIA